MALVEELRWWLLRPWYSDENFLRGVNCPLFIPQHGLGFPHPPWRSTLPGGHVHLWQISDNWDWHGPSEQPMIQSLLLFVFRRFVFAFLFEVGQYCWAKMSYSIFSSRALKRLLYPCPHFLWLVTFSCWWWWWVAPMVVVVTLSQLTFKQVGATADRLATDFLLLTKRGAPLFWALGHFSSSSQTSGVELKDNWRLVWFIDGWIFPNLTGSLPLTTSKIASFNSSAHYKRFPNRTPHPPNQTTGVLVDPYKRGYQIDPKVAILKCQIYLGLWWCRPMVKTFLWGIHQMRSRIRGTTPRWT